MSEVKSRVIATVTGREYTPSTTVVLQPGQTVVDQLQPGAVDAPSAPVEQPLEEEPLDKLQFMYDVEDHLNAELDAVLYPDTRVLHNLIDYFATGGDVPAQPTVLVGEKTACIHCGPDCYGGAAHNARVEDGTLYVAPAVPYVVPAPNDDFHPTEEEQEEADRLDVSLLDGDAYEPPYGLVGHGTKLCIDDGPVEALSDIPSTDASPEPTPALIKLMKEHRERERNRALDELLNASEAGLSLVTYRWLLQELHKVRSAAVSDVLDVLAQK